MKTRERALTVGAAIILDLFVDEWKNTGFVCFGCAQTFLKEEKTY